MFEFSASPIPFSGVRRFLEPFDLSEIAGATRFIWHAKAAPTASENDKQQPKSQIRWAGRESSLTNVPLIASAVQARLQGQAIDVVCHGEPATADLEIFVALAARGAIRFTVVERRGITDPLDPESAELLRLWEFARSEITSPEAWDVLRRAAVRYVQCGDSWAAVWLSDCALENARSPITPQARDFLALAYSSHGQRPTSFALMAMRPDRDSDLEMNFRYGEAMHLSRHFPKLMRSQEDASERLDGAAALAAELPGRFSISDRAINANGRALAKVKSGNANAAAEVLEDFVAANRGELEQVPVLYAIVLNNMGRAMAAAHRPISQFQAVFEHSIELDPRSAEFRFFYAKCLHAAGKPDAALDQLSVAESLANPPTELFRMRGHIHSELGNLDRAATAYGEAYRLSPDLPEVGLECVKANVAAGDLVTAEQVSKSLPTSWPQPGDNTRNFPGAEDYVELELLNLMIDVQLERVDESGIGAHLERLDALYPGSSLIAENRAAYSSSQ